MIEADLSRLNSMTKYPSILTYHQIGERGKLDNCIQVPFNDDDDVIITEKIDGSNARIIFLPQNDYIFGSREELIHAKGDRIWITTDGIVDTLKEHDVVSHIKKLMFDKENRMFTLDNVWVVFGEVFGGKTSSAKQYTANKNTGYRVFDVIKIPRPLSDDMVLGKGWDKQSISAWRQNGGQQFIIESEMQNWFNQEWCTPRLATIKGKDLPKSHQDVLNWLERIVPKTMIRLDDGARAKSEGVVIRTPDRNKIAKIRYEDYERTLRPIPQQKKK